MNLKSKIYINDNILPRYNTTEKFNFYFHESCFFFNFVKYFN